MTDTSFDTIVIGSGPGGYVAAIRCAQLGQKTAVIERERLGGVCLNWGCIPTKALLRSSEVYHILNNLDEYGFSARDIRFDLDNVVRRSRKVADQLSGGVKFLMRKNKVQVIEGEARLAGEGRITVEREGRSTEYRAKNIILATGARARSLPGIEPDGRLIWTYREAMVPPVMPQSLLVIGSGAIGIEFASFFRTMGADVTVVEVLDRILPVEDAEISAFAEKSFRKQGMKIHTSAKVENVEKHGDQVTAVIQHRDGKSEKLTVDRIILAVGIVGNTEGLDLDKLGIRVERGHIAVNEWCETGAPGVYAIGDVVGPPWLAHKASHEGVMVAERIAGMKDVHPLDVTNVPGCTYCLPQVASVGLTEAAAKEAGHEVRVGRFPFMANGKAIALGEPEGLVKTVFDAKTGELLGAHMIGAEVTELIQGFGIARTLETTEKELIETIFPHPTLSEMMHESVLDAYGRVLHI
ncbi:MAG: dihydrolipoyl dehydrogenase [Alphaproteobacteria bacterium]